MQSISYNYLPESVHLKKFSTNKEHSFVETVDISRNQQKKFTNIVEFIISDINYRDRDLEELRAFDYALAYHILFTENLKKLASQEAAKNTSFQSNQQMQGQPNFLILQQPGSQPNNNFPTLFPSQPSFPPNSSIGQPIGFTIQQPNISSSQNIWGQTNAPLFSNPISLPELPRFNAPFGSTNNSLFTQPQTTNFLTSNTLNQPNSSAQTFPFLSMNPNPPSSNNTGLNPIYNATASIQSSFPGSVAAATSSVPPVVYPSTHLGLYAQQPYMPPPQIHPYFYYPPPRYYPPMVDPWMGTRYPSMLPYNPASYDPSMYFSRDYDSLASSKDNINLQKLLMQRQASSALWYRYGVDPTTPLANLRPELKTLDSSSFHEKENWRDSFADFQKNRSPNKDTVINVIPTIAGIKDGKQQIILNIEETPENRSYIPKIFNPRSEISFTITSKDNSASKSYLASIVDESIEENVIYNSSKILNEIGSRSPRSGKDLPKPTVSRNYTPNRRKSILDMDLSDYALFPKVDKSYNTNITGSEKKKVRFQEDIDEQLTSMNNEPSINLSRSVIKSNHAEPHLTYNLANNSNSAILTDKSEVDPTLPTRFPPGSPYLPRDLDYVKRTSVSSNTNSRVFGGSMLFSQDRTDAVPSISNAELVTKTKWTPHWIVSAICNSFKSNTSETQKSQSPSKSTKLEASFDKLYLHNVASKSLPLIDEIAKSTQSDVEITSKCHVTLYKPGYYCQPSISELNRMTKDGKCIVNHFIVGKHDVGKALFIGEVDVYGLNLDEIIDISEYQIEVYPDENPDCQKPAVGSSLNRPAVLTLYNVYPVDKFTMKQNKNLSEKEVNKFIEHLKTTATDMGGVFVEYKVEQGAFSFMVSHFTKYGLYFKPSQDVLSSTTCGNQYSVIFDDTSVEKLIMKGYSNVMKDTSSGTSHISDKENSKSSVDSGERYLENNLSLINPHSSFEKIAKNGRKSAVRNLTIVPINNSIICRMNCSIYHDISCFMARCRRTCWFGLNLAYTSFSNNKSKHLYNKCFLKEDTLSDISCDQSVNICNWKYSSVNASAYNFLELTDLEQLFNNLTQFVSNFSDNQLPYCNITDIHLYLNAHFTGDFQGEKTFHLISALWGQHTTYTLGTADAEQIVHRKMFLNWIKRYNMENAQRESDEKLSNGDIFGAVLSLLSAQMIEEAVHLLNATNNYRLAMMLTSIHEDEANRIIHALQLDKWINDKSELYMDVNFIKIYMIISKIPYIAFESKRILHICDGFDWLRSIGMLVNYCTNTTDNIQIGFNLYVEHMHKFPQLIHQPFPSYLINPNSRFTYKDIHYYIIQLYCYGTTSTKQLFEPFTYTDSPLDYSLSWHLINILNHIYEFPDFQTIFIPLTLSYSQQLEARGYWNYSILVLLWIKDINIRKNYINSILKRNIDQATDQQLNFLRNIKLPDNLIFISKANFAYYNNDMEKRIDYLLKAREFEKAHEISIKHKLPKLLLNEKYQELFDFINQLDLNYIKNKIYFQSNAELYINSIRLHETAEPLQENQEYMEKCVDSCVEIHKNILNMEVITDYQYIARAKIVEYCLEFIVKNNLAEDIDWSNMMDLIDPDYVTIYVVNVLKALNENK